MDTLQKNKDKSLYDVPNSYFEQLQQNVIQRVKNETSRQKTIKQSISAVSVAASVAIIVTLSFYIFLNKNANEHFYTHEEITQEVSVSNIDFKQIAEAPKVVSEFSSEPKLSISNAPIVAETIVYRAVDYYLDDYTTDNFCEIMYELECYYEY